jgi:hypothetical protein
MIATGEQAGEQQMCRRWLDMTGEHEEVRRGVSYSVGSSGN